MPRGKKFTAEQIIGKLREAEVGLAQGKTVPEVVRKFGVIEQTYYRRKRGYGGLRTDQAKRLKDLEKENSRLKRLLAGIKQKNVAAELLAKFLKGQIATRDSNLLAGYTAASGEKGLFLGLQWTRKRGHLTRFPVQLSHCFSKSLSTLTSSQGFLGR